MTGIIMSAPMVRALLNGSKTQTRRLAWRVFRAPLDDWNKPWRKPTLWQSVQPGDRLWVRETHWRLGRWVKAGLTKTGRQRWRFRAVGNDVLFDDPAPEWKGTIRGGDQPARYWLRPSIFIPCWASRLTLVVTEVRRERVQDITPRDCMAEGVEGRGRNRDIVPSDGWRMTFCDLWNSLHAKHPWKDNPEVVALTFTVHQRNIDAMSEAA